MVVRSDNPQSTTLFLRYDRGIVGYVPANAKWWLADLIVEFTIDGEEGKLLHYNLTLIRADSAEEA